MKKSKLLITILFSLLVITSLGYIFEVIAINTNQLKKNEITSSIANEIIESVGSSVVSIVSGIDKDSGLRTSDMVVGTGVVYNKSKSYIVTNYHVVKSGKFYIITSDNLTYSAKLISFDEKMDIAIVRVESANLKEAKFGDSKKCNIGDNVYAIGTPLSPALKNTFIDGIISGIDRTGLSEYKLMQSNIASNPGLSGSPLINSKGEVIGINTLQSTEFGSQGLTFSIPSNDVLFALSELEKNGKIAMPYLGIEIKENSYPNYGISTISGITIGKIYLNSPAEQVKLMVNDRIVAINSIKIDNKTEYNEILRTIKSGDYLELSLFRDNAKMSKKIKINEKK